MIDHRLHVLRLLAHHGTVTATAEALHYTPSAVSAQLRSLSEQLGVPLLVPKGRGVKLTPAGRLLLSRADDLYEHWEQIRAELVAGTDETMVELRMCGFSTAAAALLPPVAARLLRTYPNLRHGRDYPFARGGERSVARGCRKAVGKAERIIYLEDQYFWGEAVGHRFAKALEEHPDLRVVVVIPLHPDVEGKSRTAELLGRARSLEQVLAAAPDRVAAYGLENHAGTPVYVHAKVCVVDDLWTTVGSDNFNRRSWTHDSELSAVVLDHDYGLDLRLTLAAEHLDRLDDVAAGELREVMADCVDPRGMFDAYAASAARLEAWHRGGRVGQRPSGRLRPIPLPPLSRTARLVAAIPLEVVHDPDGRPGPLRGGEQY